MLLSATRLLELLDKDIIHDALPELVNSTSIDIRLNKLVLLELPIYHNISLRHKEAVRMRTHDLLVDGPVTLNPGQFLLASSIESFNLPNDISAEYKLKSSMARVGLDHLNAGWCDAGWHGSVLTLELKNVSNFASITLHYEDKIGQMIFFEHEEVPMDRSYALRGRYNKNLEVSGTRPDIHSNKHSAVFNSTGEDITDQEVEEYNKNKELFLQWKDFMDELEAKKAEDYDENKN